MDRNRENMKLKKERNRAPAQQQDPGNTIAEPGFVDPDPGAAAAAGRDSMNPRGRAVGFSDTVDVREVSPRRRGGRELVDAEQRDFPASWMDYQPHPYAQVYLNSEFNRASMLQSYEEDRKQYDDASMAYVSGRVLDANTKYDLAMKKLERSLNNFSVTREDSDLT